MVLIDFILVLNDHNKNSDYHNMLPNDHDIVLNDLNLIFED